VSEDLLADVLEDPDSDEKRLVYADWLTAIGDPRGELISVQIALARAVPDDDDYPSLLRRSDELVAALAPPPYWRYVRGFVEQAQILDEDFEGALRRLLLREPVTSLAGQVTDTPLLAWIRRLDVNDANILESPHLGELRELAISTPIGDVDAMRIAALSSLEVLEVPAFNLTEEAVADLIAMPMLREIKIFGPRGLGVTVLGGLTRFELAMQNANLAALLGRLRSVTSLSVPDEGQAGVLAAWPGLARLESLAITSRAPDEIRAILDSPHLAGGTLRRLRLRGDRLESDELAALGTHPALAGLHHLDLRASIPEAGLDGFTRLVTLDVSGRIDHLAARALVHQLPRCGRMRWDDGATVEGDAILRNRFPAVSWR
jgi:uncharacterized protein (TIGR02996 family)